ncbi:conserved hypothetical protein [Sporisorium reilianum SRZ2]|uniref:Uncharacterized protein n=1 Tax=Sporisorium reilianum (strain SRZ2) TaxID=999809 RepID=E6ZMC4_SPORE|nr:conserved hypothetical protein [Sporisorium reilianum SRZ2]
MDDAYKKCAKTASYYELHQGLQPFVHWHVVESVQEGCGPEAIGDIQQEAEVEALVLERRSIARDHALGFFISLLHHYLARQSGSASIDAAISALLADLDKQPPVASFSDFHLDTAEIYEYIHEQRQNAGVMADDYEWHMRTKVSAELQWPVLFQKSLERTRMAYVEACQRFEHRFALGSQADLALVQLVSSDDLARLASQSKAQPRHVPAPPTSDEANTTDYWGKRIGNSTSSTSKVLPEFDPAHLIHAGQQFRAACLDLVRAQHASQPDKDVNAVLSEALNPETNPERLVKRAQHLWTPQSATAPDNDEAPMKEAKDLLSSALRILGTRDSERNISLAIDAHNLRAHINHRLAALKPQHRVNYINRAVADWSASIDLDPEQNDIVELLAQIEAQHESDTTNIAAGSDDQDERQPSNSKQTVKAKPGKRSISTPSKTAKQPSTATGSNAKESSSNAAKKPVTKSTDTSAAENPNKARDKTILESPFFRTDLVTGLMVDSLLNLAFPHHALRETLRFPSAASVSAASQDYVPMLDRLAKAHQLTAKSLTPENKTQLQTAIKTVSAVLALPELQRAARDDVAATLRRTSLQLVLGTLFLLAGDLVKAQTELELVSNALRPSNARGGVRTAALSVPAEATAPENAAAPAQQQQHMQTRVQGQTLLLLAKTCWMANKVQEAVKFFRWFVRWYSEQQAQRVADRARAEDGEDVEGDQEAVEVELEQVDMGWWDRVVVVSKA